MADEDPAQLSGEVETDETYIGGRRRGLGNRGRPKPGHTHYVAVLGMVQRKGRVIATVVPDVKTKTVMPHVTRRVLPSTVIYTDENLTYKNLGKRGFQHRRIHHQEQVYVMGDVHTNTIEGFWSLVKRGLSGVYHSVSAKHLQGYLNEYAWRYNHRNEGRSQFDTLIERAAATDH